MKIRIIENKKEYSDFIKGQDHAQFLQSFEWGEFQEKIGNKVIRLGVEDKGRIIAAATLIKKNIPLGMSYFFCPRGPVFNLELKIKNEELINFLYSEIKKISKKEKVIFLRFEPQEMLPAKSYQLRAKKTIDIEPSQTSILNLTKTEDELLKVMHQKTRYNIRLAEKKGVEIQEARKDDFEKFWKIMEETKDRDGFRLHGKEHYQKMLEIDFNRLFLAKYDGKLIAGIIAAFFGDTVTYVHGASSNEHRETMAPYLLQWQAIKKAKADGYKFYDFYGTDETKWPGVTRFKKGFGGSEVVYPGTFDLVFEGVWYDVYRIGRKIRRL
jgi:peptidoglycan pentaglycine glycine transferase (the first glycine)